MKYILILILPLISSIKTFSQNDYKVFHTSICYDLLSSMEYSEKLLNTPEFHNLKNDTLFINSLDKVNEYVKASNICNLYSIANLSKDDLCECLFFFDTYNPDSVPTEYKGKYLQNIYKVKSEINYVLNRLVSSGYKEYWQKSIQPYLLTEIDKYKFEPENILELFHLELTKFAGKEKISDEYSKIYIIDIGNAFALNDETFCCTPLLLDKELAKRFRINFIQVYFHENLHRLYISDSLIGKLNELYQKDAFYKKHEDIAIGYGEGKNEAFVVAAECFISKKLGLKTNQDVYREFKEYIDGSLVLAPIIYLSLNSKMPDTSYNIFLLDLFETKLINSDIEALYTETMKIINTEK